MVNSICDRWDIFIIILLYYYISFLNGLQLAIAYKPTIYTIHKNTNYMSIYGKKYIVHTITKQNTVKWKLRVPLRNSTLVYCCDNYRMMMNMSCYIYEANTLEIIFT